MAIANVTLANSDVVAGQKFYAANYLALIAQIQTWITDEVVAKALDNDSAQAVAGVKTFSAIPVFSAGANMGAAKITAVLDPTAAQDGATKAYVDAAVGSLGTRTAPTITDGSNVQVSVDGFLTIIATCTTEMKVTIKSDSSATPTTQIAVITAQPNTTDKIVSVTVPIKKDDYYRVDIETGTGTLAGVWIPFS